MIFPIKYRYHIIVEDGTEEEIVQTAKSIDNQYFEAEKVTFVKNIDKVAEFYNYLCPIMKLNRFSIYMSLIEEYEGNTIDNILKARKSDFYILVKGGYVFDDDFLFLLNDKIASDKKFPTGIVEDDIKIFNYKVHRLLSGNIGIKLEDKITAFEGKYGQISNSINL